MQQVDWKKFFGVVVVLLLLGNFANSYYERRDRQASTAVPIPGTTPPLRVMSSSQSSDGVTAAQLTPQLAAKLEEYGTSRIAAKLAAMATQAGASHPTPKITAESTVIQTQGKTLIVIRYQINAAARAVEAIGISGQNLRRVMCTRDSLEEILLTIGPCAEKILEVHGVAIGA